MKMKMKMALAAGALALASVGQASAAVINTAGLGNNVVLTVYDTVTGTSFAANLGSTIQSFLTGASVTFGGTSAAPAITGNAVAANNLTYTNAALTSFMSTATAGATVWNVASGTNTGAAASYGGTGILTTYSGAVMPVTTAGAVGNAITGAYNYTSGINSVIGAGTTITALSSAGLSGGNAATMGNFNGATTWSNATAVGQNASFLFITPSTPNSRGTLTGSAVYQFANAGGASTWNLASNGTLTYATAAAAVAPVPEPGEWLLMLSGLALIGFIATRRKDEGGMTFA